MQLRLKLSLPVLEAMLRYACGVLGPRWGVSIDRLKLDLQVKGDRSAEFHVDLTGVKRVGFVPVGFELTFRGTVTLKANLDLFVHGLKAGGRGTTGLLGTVAKMFVNAVSLVQQAVGRLEGQAFSLRQFFPDLVPEDCRIRECADGLEVLARFADPSAG